MKIVTERLLHEEGKLKEKYGGSGGEIKAMASEHHRKGKSPRCNNCHRFGHIQKDCRELARGSIDSVHKRENAHKGKYKAHRATAKRRDNSSSDSDIFIDDKTHYLWVYILKRKDEVLHKFLKWKAVEEKSTGRRLKILRTDNGGEYTSAEFESYLSYLKTEGVLRQLTIPKTPEQNGIAERMNRTLVETVRSMLTDAELSPMFWAEALSTAVYLRNRITSKALKDITPHEAWTGKKPNVEHLRTLGCTAYAHVRTKEVTRKPWRTAGGLHEAARGLCS